MQRILVAFLLLLSARESVAYDPIAQRNDELRSFASAKSADVFFYVSFRFFSPLKQGETVEQNLRRSYLGGGDEIDRALDYGGRVPRNVELLLFSELRKRFGVVQANRKVSTHKLDATAIVRQLLDIQGKDLFQIELNLKLLESAKTRSGLQGFAEIKTFRGNTFAATKGEIEGAIFSALDQAIQAMQAEYEKAKQYCESVGCLKSVPQER